MSFDQTINQRSKADQVSGIVKTRVVCRLVSRRIAGRVEMVAGSESPGYGSQNRLPMRDVYSDSTPCVVTVQKNASRYKQRVQSTEREIAALSLRDPLSLLAYAQNFRPFLSLENPPTPHRLSPPPALPDRPSLSFFFSSRCFAQGQGQKLVRKGVAPPPVRYRAVMLYCGDDHEHGKRPGLLSAAVRSSSWDMRATLRNRVGDRRAQAIFVQQGRRLHLPFRPSITK